MNRPPPRSPLLPHPPLSRSLCARHKVQVEVAAEVERMMTNVNLVAAGVGLSIVPASVRGADRKSTRLNSSHGYISYAVFCLKKKNYYRHLTPPYSTPPS